MLIILDNAESVLDPRGVDGRKIYPVVEELSDFKTICLCITSRITTVPRLCKRPIIPTLSVEAACNIFYSIYDHGDQSDIISDLLGRLDFHALSITLLATTASHNLWDHHRLAKEWDTHHVQVLQTDYNESLAATIELSLSSPMFCELGPNAHDLLGVIAFFPQGVDDNNLEWLFPTISNRQTLIDKICALSLTYRNGHFITMLAPLRDYLSPKDPKSSLLLCVTKECYFKQLSVDLGPDKPGFEEAKWIMSEDVNVEHLLDVFTSTDTDSDDVWNACTSFMWHLFWHKPQLVMLGPKLKGLPDNHTSKPYCLHLLSRLFSAVGNWVEEKELLVCALELWRRQGDNSWIAATLDSLADVNKRLGHYAEGIQQVKESMGMHEQLNDTIGQSDSLRQLAALLCQDGQFDAAEQAVFQSIDLLDKGEQFRLCYSYYHLGGICRSKGETEKAIGHYETALGLASPSWRSQNFWIFYSLAGLFFYQSRFNDAHAYIERAKLHAVNDMYCLGRAMERQAEFWYQAHRFEEAKSEILCAVGEYEKLGAVKYVEDCRKFLQSIEEEMNEPVTSNAPDSDGESLETLMLPMLTIHF